MSEITINMPMFDTPELRLLVPIFFFVFSLKFINKTGLLKGIVGGLGAVLKGWFLAR